LPPALHKAAPAVPMPALTPETPDADAPLLKSIQPLRQTTT